MQDILIDISAKYEERLDSMEKKITGMKEDHDIEMKILEESKDEEIKILKKMKEDQEICLENIERKLLRYEEDMKSRIQKEKEKNKESVKENQRKDIEIAELRDKLNDIEIKSKNEIKIRDITYQKDKEAVDDSIKIIKQEISKITTKTKKIKDENNINNNNIRELSNKKQSERESTSNSKEKYTKMKQRSIGQK